MRKLSASLLMLLIVLWSLSPTFAQSRPRRVGAGTSQSGQAPSQSATQAPTRPTGPPVLSGANRPAGQNPSTSQTPEHSGPEEVAEGDIVKVNTTLVSIPVSVMDRDGRYVPNLSKEDFRIWEDGVEQQVAFFASVEKPFSVFLMLDTSPSTKFRLEDIQNAAITFVNQLRPDDKVMVVSFSREIKVLSELTSDRNQLQRAILRAHTGDGTSIYDAMDLVINRYLSRISGRKAIVLFTDGVDTTSQRADYDSTVVQAQELDALIYPVRYDTSRDIDSGFPPMVHVDDIFGQILGGIFGGGRRGGGSRGGWPGPRGGRREDYEMAGQYLRLLAASTGGRLYDADSLQNMASAFANVAEELRRQYSIGYYPKRPPQPGQRREIRVRTTQPNLAVRARDSYIFNPSGTAIIDASGRTPNPPVLRKLSVH